MLAASVSTLILLFLTGVAPDSTCAASRKNTMKFSIQSKRNATGHWTAQVNLQHDGNNAIENSFWDVDLEHSSLSCDGIETINIEATITAPPEIPGPGYELFPGMGYYKFHVTPLKWREAFQVCTQEGAHLAIINSKKESTLIADIFARFPKIPNTDESYAFLGYHDFYKEGQFETIFGQSLNTTGFSTFMAGQPNNLPVGVDKDQDCGGVHRQGLLNDLPCSTKYAFFCEMELPQ